MPKRLSRRRKPEDASQAAFRVVQRIIQKTEGEPLDDARPKADVVPISRHRKNPAAVALGRKGGQKSAAGRMEKIAPDERRRIASHAARQRWARRKEGDG